jgi:hypothetical protein
MTAWSDPVLGVRATRAQPPGRARDGARRRTYGAALAQFDELLAAARSSGPASRPVALFYALSQAGRALAAAHAEHRWRLYGHGLEAPRLDKDDLLSIEVRRPSQRQNANEPPERIDSFAGVAEATGSELATGHMPLGGLWAAVPDAAPLLDDARWPRTLLVVADEPGTDRLFPWDRASATAVGFSDLTAAGVREQLRHYPGAITVHIEQPQGIPLVTAPTSAGYGARLYWPTPSPDLDGQRRALDAVAPADALGRARWLRPRVGGAALSDLMLWWALLFGLSMLARYEPDGWTAALDYDNSPLAVPLTALLDTAAQAVPALVLAALDA